MLSFLLGAREKDLTAPGFEPVKIKVLRRTFPLCQPTPAIVRFSWSDLYASLEVELVWALAFLIPFVTSSCSRAGMTFGVGPLS